MPPEKFRRQLRQEADRWQTEELIDRDQYQRLAERYSFAALDANSSSRFTMILIGLGSVLLGLGVITFVASNWQEMSRELRVGLLLTALVSSNWLGFHLWQNTTNWKRLGQGFLILGALILGANIALMGQIFHIDGDLYGLFFTWGFGVLLMAYGLRFTPLGIMAILLIGLGYIFHWGTYWNSYATDQDVVVKMLTEQMLAIAAFVLVPLAYWCKSRSIGILAIILTVLVYVHSWSKDEVGFLAWALREYMPIAATFMFIPLAYWCRSRSVFMFAMFAVVTGIIRSAFILNSFAVPSYVILSIALTLPPALLWAYQDILFPRWRSTSPTFAHLAHNLALMFLGGVCYFQSFYFAWNVHDQTLPDPSKSWSSLLNIVLFTGITIFLWSKLLVDRSSDRSVITKIIAGFLSVEVVVMIWHGVAPIPEIATFIYNVLLFLLAMGLIRISLEKSIRSAFWIGIALVSLQVFSRLFEYDTDLLLKSLIFGLCGVAVITAGLWFERHLKLNAVNPTQTNLPSSVEEIS